MYLFDNNGRLIQQAMVFFPKEIIDSKALWMYSTLMDEIRIIDQRGNFIKIHECLISKPVKLAVLLLT
jgi:hypothetical protein